MSIETASVNEDVHMTVKSPLFHLCPFREEEDQGEVTIRWKTAGATLELHALRALLDGYRTWTISHEDLTTHLRNTLHQMAGVSILGVETAWQTAGMEVSCSTSQTPVGHL